MNSAGKKRKLEDDLEAGETMLQQNSAAGSEKNPVVADSSGKNKEPGDLKNPELVKVQPSSSWRKPIAELQNGVDLSQKTVVGKVVKKSDLHTYETKDKQKRFFFYLGIADDSACIKVMVYRMDKYSFFEEGECYNFRNVIVKENMIKFTMNSSTSKFCKDKLDVPKELELKARMLIYGQDSAVCSEEIKRLDEKKRVSVEGTVTELQSAALQKDQIEIIGIKETGKLRTKLDVAIDGQFKVLSVKSAVLAEALGIQQGSNFEDRVLEKIPCLARAEIKGDTILTFTV
ncbi:uncharacterized protein LOC112140721 isoform X2 [Oryzias melastigma]|uniref:uncharacterized protein LOC112140721 isoform X2 n=1 Tax=Oryzias melastigma TaxID=30732 RepID=UPI00168D39C1|nr:uncharacterized protein LOC112140721 isoform X2 [Oryzias melastigma]